MTATIDPTDTMKHRYEALLVLDTKGKEDSANEIISRLEADFKTDGASVENIQRMDNRSFSYAAGKLESGYYVNFIFSAEPETIEKLRSRLRLDADVYRQHYQRLPEKK